MGHRAMRVWDGLEAFPAEAAGHVVSIGNYDGVHRGHQAILAGAVAHATELGVSTVLLTFEPHPLAVVAPERRPRLLQTRGQKLESLERTGIDHVVFLHFDRELAALSGEAFFARVVTPQIRLRAVHVGENFRFGHGRRGDLELLRRIGAFSRFEVRGVPSVECDGRIVSSSAIREAVSRGEVEEARRMLSRPFALLGEVVRGAGRGRKLQFPTANIDVQNDITPRNGVYITEARALANRHPSVTNVGVRPTFGGDTIHVESHLIGFEDELYGELVEVRFLARIRDEMRFPGELELADQIARDRAAAEAFFQNIPLQTPS